MGLLDDPVLPFLVVCSAVKHVVWYLLEKQQWRLVGHVSGLYLYPVKSARGIQVSSADFTASGLEVDDVEDRHWVLVDKDGKSLNLKGEPSLALVCPRVGRDSVQLTAPGMDPLTLPVRMSPVGRNSVKTKVIGEPVEGVEVGEKANEWVSAYLGKPGTRLLCSASRFHRRNVLDGPTKWHANAQDGDQVVYQNFSPCMIMSQASLDDMNTKAAKPTTVWRFRPNILVTGCDPFQEDEWSKVKISSVGFSFLRLCKRCPIINVDPETGQADEHQETTKMLQKFRLVVKEFGTAPCVGVNMTCHRAGNMKVGDPVFAMKKS